MTLPLIACVKTGDKFGPEYVTRLRNGVARHLPVPHRFVCFTDQAVEGVDCQPLPLPLPGWWAKIGLCEIAEPLVYFDLDVIIAGDLSPLLVWDGFGILNDPWVRSLNSSVMVLTGRERDISRMFRPEMMARLTYGDQQWFTMCRPNARVLPEAWFPSYKAHALYDGPPDGARGIVFHGTPKPHDITSGWVPELWKQERNV